MPDSRKRGETYKTNDVIKRKEFRAATQNYNPLQILFLSTIAETQKSLQ